MNGSLGLAALRAALWSYAGTIAKVLAQFTANIVFARMLGPGALGAFALILLVVGPCKLLGELGLGSALVQRRDLSDGDVGRAFAWLMGMGVATTIGVLGCAAPLASLLGAPDMAHSLRLMAPVFCLFPPLTLAEGLLARRMDQRGIQTAQVVAYALGFVGTGLGCLALGFGSDSLVLGFVAQTGLEASLAWSMARPRLRSLQAATGPAIWHFSLRVVATNLSNWVIENMDNFLVNQLFGVRALGLYAVSYNLVKTPTGHLVTSLQSVLFPATARTRQDTAEVAQAFLAVLALVAMVLFPTFVGMALAAGTVVDGIYGGRWHDAAPLLAPLALAMPLYGVSAVVGPILWGRGLVGRELAVQWKVAGLLLVTLPLLSFISLAALAWGVLGVYAVRMAWLTEILRRNLDIRRGDVWRALRGGVLLSIAVGAAIAWTDAQLAGRVPGAPERLMVDIACGALAGLLVLVMGARWLLSDPLRRAVEWLIPILPKGVRVPLNWTLGGGRAP